MRALGYVRVSTAKQAESGLSLEAQRDKIQAMAVVKGAELTDVLVDEAESAKDLNRPAVRELLDKVKRHGVEMVIIAKLDRLTRSVRDLADIVDLFNRKGVALISVAETLDTTSAGGRLVLNMIATVSQWEREVISERTGEALRAKKKRGEAAGNVPYGFRRVEGGKLEIEASEARVIARIRVLRGGGKSLREIARILNEEGIRTRKGGPWAFQYVANVLEAAQLTGSTGS